MFIRFSKNLLQFYYPEIIKHFNIYPSRYFCVFVCIYIYILETTVYIILNTSVI